MKIRTEQFVEIAREEMKNTRSKAFLGLLPPVINAMRQISLATFPDPDAAQAYGAAIRGEVVTRLPELLEEFERNATARGTKVVWARTAAEANAFVLDLAKKKGVAYVTKGKSMLSEEIGLNDALIDNGVDAIETDLGEFIIQLLKRPPFHLIGPAVNIAVEEVRDLFMEKGILAEPTEDPVALGYAARLHLRDKFHRLEMGVTGVNMAVAETGTIVNVENEGNIRFAKSSPRTQVSIMSLEKVVPTMADALHMIRLLCRNGTGQKMASYISFDTGPRAAGAIDGPEEVYCVIVDNGRADLYDDPVARDVFRCIRCGACANICPVYTKIGGYPYGWAYTGPMGQLLNPLLLGFSGTSDLFRACTLCGVCKSVCPAGVDHPRMFLYYRARDAAGDPKLRSRGRPLKERTLYDLFAWGATHPRLWRQGAKRMRPRVNRDARDGYLSRSVDSLDGWFRSRDLPEMAEKTFQERWKEREGRKAIA